MPLIKFLDILALCQFVVPTYQELPYKVKGPSMHQCFQKYSLLETTPRIGDQQKKTIQEVKHLKIFSTWSSLILLDMQSEVE